MGEALIPEQVEVSGIKINKDLSKGPYFVDGKDTLAKLWKLRCEKSKEKIAHREKKYGIFSVARPCPTSHGPGVLNRGSG